ncbi:hypothetical protein IKX64_01795 [Candidatus Saccharibacteria bacterium]|nr:hypothetical protein [Candidatus Saccharibacteria bacterium]
MPDKTPKSNTGDMGVFEQSDIQDKLNNKYVFVGLNTSSTHGKQQACAWKNFHSDYSYQNDYKLRFAFKNTRFWGSYITDIIKKYPEVDSAKVKAMLKDNPKIVSDNIKDFKRELSLLSSEKPILVAIGNDSYEILKNNLDDEYVIKKIPHYSIHISKEKYREMVLESLGDYHDD